MKLTFFSALVASAAMAVDLTSTNNEDNFDLDFADIADDDALAMSNPSFDDFAQRYYSDLDNYGTDDDFDEDGDSEDDRKSEAQKTAD